MQPKLTENHGIYRIEGHWNEGIGPVLAALSAKILVSESKTLVLDCSAVRNVSTGSIEPWCGFLEGLRAAGVAIELRELSPALVDSANIFGEMVRGAAVASIVLPLRCSACGATANAVLPSADVQARAIPQRTCGSCGTSMEAGVDLDGYASFLDCAEG